MALQSLEDRNNLHPELEHLGVEYLTKSYRFYTPEGRQNLVNLMINNKHTQDETKELFKLLLSQFSSSQSNLSELDSNTYSVPFFFSRTTYFYKFVASSFFSYTYHILFNINVRKPATG